MNFPHWLSEHPEHSGVLPEAVDCVVIGGGVIGVTAALYMAREGMKVVLLEKGRIGAEQSTRNWGWIRTQGRDMAEIPLSLEARGLWRDLDQDCKSKLGIKTVGVSYLANSDKSLGRFETWLRLASQHTDLDSRILSRREVMAMFPLTAAKWHGALHTPSDMRGEPWIAVPEIARLAVSEGVIIRESCAARGLEHTAGTLSAVITESGSIRTEQVVVAAGAWSSLFLRAHGVSLPQLSVRSTVATTIPSEVGHEGAAVDGVFAWRLRDDGGYTLAPAAYSELFIGPDAFRAFPSYMKLLRAGGFDVALRPWAPKGFPDAWSTARKWRMDEVSPFEKCRILDPEPNRRKLSELPERFAAAFPSNRAPVVSKAWAGMIDVMPDVVPVVDRLADLDGVIVATGMCGHGFGIGPAFGLTIAKMALGQPPKHDLTRFRSGRFSDGTPLVPGPNL